MRNARKSGLGLLITFGLAATGLAAAGIGGCKETPPGGTPKASDGPTTASSTATADKVAEAKPTAPVPAPKPTSDTPPPAPISSTGSLTPAKPAAEMPAPPAPEAKSAETPKPQPMPSLAEPETKPVAEAPTPPEPKPAAEAPAPTPPEPKPAAEAPAPTPPEPKPAAEAPAPTPPEPKPAAEAPAPTPPEPKPAAEAPAPTPAPTPMPPPKGKYQAQFHGKPVKTWAIQLQNPDPEVIARTPYDVVTIDYSRDASASGAFSKADVAKMKLKPDGSERVLIAYMSIGEIEDYRYYWLDNGWNKKAKRPSWIGAENPEWLHNYTVKFWNQGWKDIIFAKPNSYLDKIIEAGFDGVYLDKIDITDVLEDDAPKGKTAFGLMVEFVQGIRAAADKRKPGFIMVASNAEAALDDDDYRATMSAIGKEDLYYNSRFNSKTGKLIDGYPNDAGAIKEQVRLLQKLIDDDKVVLSVEYLDSKPDLIQPTAKKLVEHGYVPYFGPRDLARLSGFKYVPTSLAATVRKAAQCTTLAEDACGKEKDCVWLPGYQIDAAIKVPGYCRIAPIDTTPRLNIEARE